MNFTVQVCRISYQFADIEADAPTQEEADKKALDEAGSHLYEEKNVEYALADSPSKAEAIGQAAIELVKVLERAGLGEDCKEEIQAIRDAIKQ